MSSRDAGTSVREPVLNPDDGVHKRHVAVPTSSSDSDGDDFSEEKHFTFKQFRRECWVNPGVYLVIAAVGFVQGSRHLSSLAVNYYFKDDLHLSPAALSVAMGFITLPWVVKPLYGFISDSFPIFGRRRAPYFFIFGAFGFLCWLLLSIVEQGMIFSVAVLVGASLSVAFCNVLAEALIVEKGGEHKGHINEVKDKIAMLMTLYWGTESLAKLITGPTSGYLVDHISKRTIFFFTGLFPATLCFMSFFMHEAANHVRASFWSQWTLLRDHFSHPYIWKPAVFMFIWTATPNSQASYFYFLTNDIKLKPTFMGMLVLVEGVSSIIGLTLYNIFWTKTPFRKILYWTIVMAFVAGLTPLILITHVNRQLGLADSWFTIGDSALLAGVGQVAILPLLILGAQTCPKAVEGTLYALLMSTLNVGGVVSDYLGGGLTWALGVDSNNFSNLWILVLICNLCNLIPIPFLYFLVPTSEQLREYHEEHQAKRNSAASSSDNRKDARHNSNAAAAAAAAEDYDDFDDDYDESEPLVRGKRRSSRRDMRD